MKITRTQLNDEIYRQFKKMILEQADEPGVGGPYEKIKQLAELGKKIEQQIQNSLVHLNAFLNVGTKTEDSFEFRRAVAEIGRIQKLAADYSTVLAKAHELAEEASTKPEEAPTTAARPAVPAEPSEVREIDMKKANAVVAANKPARTPKVEPPIEDDDAEVLNKGGKKDWYEEGTGATTPKCPSCNGKGCPECNWVGDDKQDSRGNPKPDWREAARKRAVDANPIKKESAMSDLSIAIDDAAEVVGKDPQAIARYLKKDPKYAKIDPHSLAKMVHGWLSNPEPQLRDLKRHQHNETFGFILKDRFSESVMGADIKAQSMREAAIKVATKYPTFEVKHIIIKEAVNGSWECDKCGRKLGTTEPSKCKYCGSEEVSYDEKKAPSGAHDQFNIRRDKGLVESDSDVDAFVDAAFKKGQSESSIRNALEDRFGMGATDADSAVERGKAEFARAKKHAMKKEMAQPDGSRADGGSGIIMDPNKSELQESWREYSVKKIGSQWYIVDKKGKNVEGGFFSKDAADTSCQEWNAQAEYGQKNEEKTQAVERGKVEFTRAKKHAMKEVKEAQHGYRDNTRYDADMRASKTGGPARPRGIEAHGVMGMKSKPWRKTFKNADALNKWVEANGAEVYGTREADSGAKGMKEDENKTVCPNCGKREVRTQGKIMHCDNCDWQGEEAYEDLPAPRQGDQGSGLAMPPDKHEMQETVKVTDMNGQDINVRDRVSDMEVDPKTGKFTKISRETFKVEKIVSDNQIIVKDLQTGKSMSVNPKDVVRKGATHIYDDNSSAEAECPQCKGKGIVQKHQKQNNITYTSDAMCDKCKGSGTAGGYKKGLSYDKSHFGSGKIWQMHKEQKD